MGRGFHRSPLSPGVPLEGSETVVGLRQLHQLRRSEAVRQSLGVPGGSRVHYERYRGPYLHQLTLDHMQQAPRAWPDFLYAPLRPVAAAAAAAYNVPCHTLMLCERMEENLVHFLVNYLTVAAAFGLHLMLQHPWVLLSIVAMLASRTSALQAPDTQGPQVQVDGAPSDLRRLLLVVLAYAAFFLSGCGGGLLRCLPVLGATVALHAALRRAPTEYRAPGGEALGVPFGDFLRWRGGERGRRDPYRVFKELFWAAVETVSDAAAYHWYSVKSWSWALWDSLLRRRSAAAFA